MCKVQVNVNSRVDHAYRIYQYIFHSGKYHTGNATHYSNKFYPCSLLYAFNKLLINTVHALSYGSPSKIAIQRDRVNKKAPGKELFHDILVYCYSASATTSFTSGIILFIIPSMPAFNVIMEDGQPEQDPCSIRFTTPSS